MSRPLDLPPSATGTDHQNADETAPPRPSQTATGAAALSPEDRTRLAELALDATMRKHGSAISPVVLTGLVRLADFCLIALVGLAVQLAYVWPADGFHWTYAAALTAGAALSVIAFQAADIYTPHAMRTYVRQNLKLFVAWSGVFGILAVTAFFLQAGATFSRVWFGAWFLGGLVTLFAFRAVLARLVRGWTRNGRLERRAVIVGGGEPAARLIQALEESPDTDIRICGVFDDRGDERSPPIVGGYLKLGTVRQLVDFARRTRVDLLIVSLPITAETRLLELLKLLWVLPVDIRLSAHTNRLRFRPRSYAYIGNVPFIPVFDKPVADWDYVMKWLFDRILGSLLALSMLPVMALVALAVKLDSPGPVLFRQKRYGFNNELIEVFKFRSMYVDDCDANASRLVTRDDDRVTRVGRFIRRTSLDELPQLFNVVRGELSLVGPRPHALQAKAEDRMYDDVVDGYFARHRVRPGITGWAQINGWRGETDTRDKIERRVEHDLYYIENWSVAFDLYIVLMTPLALMSMRNAH